MEKHNNLNEINLNIKSKMSSSRIRQNYYNGCEGALNKLANLELQVSYVYMSMSFHFDRDDAAMSGFYDLFQEHSKSEYGAAEKIFAYQNMRGGRIVLQDVNKPPVNEWSTGLEAVSLALQLEKSLNLTALDAHRLAGELGDKETCDWLEDHILQAKVESIKKFGEHITNLKKVGPGLGEYFFERETLN